MKCDKVKELLSAYLDGEMSEREAAQVRRHLEECLDCEEAALELDEVRQMVHNLPKVTAPAELAERVSQQLEQTTNTAPENIFWRYRWVLRGAATAAALFLVVYAGIVLMPHQPSVETKAPENVAARESKDNRGETKPKSTLAIGKTAAPAPATSPGLLAKDAVNNPKSKETNEIAQRKSDQQPVAFSQAVYLASKDKDKAIQAIKDAASQCSYSVETLTMDNNDGFTAQTITAPTAPGASAARGGGGKAGVTEGGQKTGKTYALKVVLTLEQKEAFIEKLKLQKVGNVKVAELTTIPGGTLTANKMLEERMIQQVTEKLDNKRTNLEQDGVVDKSIEEKRHVVTQKQEEPNHTVTKGSPRKEEDNSFGDEDKKEPKELDKIEKDLVVLYDLEQQKKTSDRMNRVRQSDKEETLTLKAPPAPNEVQSTPETCDEEPKQTEFPLVELVIILEDK